MVHRRTSRNTLIVLSASLVIGGAAGAAWGSHSFGDVTEQNVFHDDIAWLSETGITKGCNPPTNSSFCPDDPVTRGQMAAFLRRLAEAGVADAATLGGQAPDDFVGPRGPEGPEGPQGPEGPEGAQGEQGEGLSLDCADGQVAKWDGGADGWTCADAEPMTIAGTCEWPANETTADCSFGITFSTLPVVVVTRANSSSVSSPWISDTTTTGFTMQSGSQPTTVGQFNFVAVEP